MASAFGFTDRVARSVELAAGTRLLLMQRGPRDSDEVMVPAILIEVESMARLRKSAGGEHGGSREGAVWLPPSQMHGLWIGFVERSAK